MANPATTDDIELRWRPLTSSESLIANTRLDDAWRLLKRLVASIEARMVGDEDLTADVVQVLSDSVIRLLRVGDLAGYKSATVSLDDASRSYQLADEYSNGALYFTDAELEAVSPPGDSFRVRAFSVQPS